MTTSAGAGQQARSPSTRQAQGGNWPAERDAAQELSARHGSRNRTSTPASRAITTTDLPEDVAYALAWALIERYETSRRNIATSREAQPVSYPIDPNHGSHFIPEPSAITPMPAISTRTMAAQVHLVGSVPNSEEVFRTAAKILGERIKRMPSDRRARRLVQWRHSLLRRRPQFELARSIIRRRAIQQLLSRRARIPRHVRFVSWAMPSARVKSYAVIFARLVGEGVIPAATRFPGGNADAARFPASAGSTRARRSKAYFQSMMEEIAALPRSSGRNSRDPMGHGVRGADPRACTESIDDTRDGLMEHARLGGALPAEVELGYHFCYGGHEPRTFARAARYRGDGRSRQRPHMPHRIDFVHMRCRAAATTMPLAPLARLALRPQTDSARSGAFHGWDGRHAAPYRGGIARAAGFRHRDGMRLRRRRYGASSKSTPNGRRIAFGLAAAAPGRAASLPGCARPAT